MHNLLPFYGHITDCTLQTAASDLLAFVTSQSTLLRFIISMQSNKNFVVFTVLLILHPFSSIFAGFDLLIQCMSTITHSLSNQSFC